MRASRAPADARRTVPSSCGSGRGSRPRERAGLDLCSSGPRPRACPKVPYILALAVWVMARHLAFRVAVAALVKGITMVIVAQLEAGKVPGMGGQPAPMQEEHRRLVVPAPVQVVHPQAVGVQEPLLGWRDILELQVKGPCRF